MRLIPTSIAVLLPSVAVLRSLLICALAAAVAVGCGGAGAPPSANIKLRAGGTGAYEKRVSELRGTPIVVNQWASWCGPCREEFPYFQQLAKEYEGRVAFLGVNSRDSRDGAEGFLAKFPTPYEHYEDPDGEIARLFRGGRAWPTTAFYTADGKVNYTKQGSYRDEAGLRADIDRYALGG